MTRDVLKSDTCSLRIPELDVEVGPYALAGRFTTVEGLLQAARSQLEEQSAFFFGDSAEGGVKQRLEQVFAFLDDLVALRRTGTLELDDPAGNSYIQSLNDEGADPRLQKVYYERSFEQNDELGLNDMKVENYGELECIAEEAEAADG